MIYLKGAVAGAVVFAAAGALMLDWASVPVGCIFATMGAAWGVALADLGSEP